MADVIESAASGRSKCRACGQAIAKGELRFGEEVPNPFTEGLTTLWFHLECAAQRRPEKLRPVLAERGEEAPERERLLQEAAEGEAHPRLARIAKVERAPSGRARCKECKESIAKDELRIGLEIFDDGRFNPMGFIHLSCQTRYFGVPAAASRLKRPAASLDQETREEVERALRVEV